jgi:hypothetical protein
MVLAGEVLGRWGRGSPAKLRREVRLRSMGDSLAVDGGAGVVWRVWPWPAWMRGAASAVAACPEAVEQESLAAWRDSGSYCVVVRSSSGQPELQRAKNRRRVGCPAEGAASVQWSGRAVGNGKHVKAKRSGGPGVRRGRARGRRCWERRSGFATTRTGHASSSTTAATSTAPSHHHAAAQLHRQNGRTRAPAARCAGPEHTQRTRCDPQGAAEAVVEVCYSAALRRLPVD